MHSSRHYTVHCTATVESKIFLTKLWKLMFFYKFNHQRWCDIFSDIHTKDHSSSFVKIILCSTSHTYDVPYPLSLSHIFLIYPLSFIFIPIFFHIISIHPLFHFFLILSKYFFLEKYPDDHFLKIVTLAQNGYPHFKLRVTFSSYPQLLKRDSLKCNMKYHFLKPSPLQFAACLISNNGTQLALIWF